MLDVDKDLIVQAYNNGVRLIKPPPKYMGMQEETIAHLFELPLNMIFLNKDSMIQNINENNLDTLGLVSKKSALGKTISSIYKNNSADFSIKHDLEVLKTRNLIIKEEYCERIDGVSFQSITSKLPLYNDNNEIIGIFGCSMSIGLNNCNIQESFLSFINLKLFPLKINIINSFLPGKMIKGVYLSRREVECSHYLVQGKSAKMIGKILNLSPRTVEYYLNNIKTKIGAHSKAELIYELING